MACSAYIIVSYVNRDHKAQVGEQALVAGWLAGQHGSRGCLLCFLLANIMQVLLKLVNQLFCKDMPVF